MTVGINPRIQLTDRTREFETPVPATPARGATRRFRWWDYVLYSAFTLLHIVVITRILQRWLTQTDWGATWLVLPFLAATVLIEVMLWEWRWLTLPLMRVPARPAPRRDWRVAAAVTFVPGSESIDMLEQTVRAIVDIRYPHDTWVLDEGDDERVRELCVRLGARHFSRKGIERFQQPQGSFRSRTKYGNYNAWLEVSGYDAYDMVVAFDSDHIPRSDYLDAVLGFFEAHDVAFVQPAQAYYNQKASIIARAAAEETYAYFSSILMAAFGVGYPLVVGCHNTHRTAALKEINGFPAHEADDMVMTLKYRARGWRGIYVPRILARGLVPVDWAGYLNQQRRWARSVLDYKFRIFPRHARQLPALERFLNYVHGLYYLRGIVTAIQVSLLLLILATGFTPPGPGAWFLRDTLVVAATMLLCDAYRQRFYLDRREWGLHWRAGLIGQIKWPWFAIAAVDAVRGQYGEYVITSKAKAAGTPRGFVATQITIAVLVATAWTIGLWRAPSPFIAVHIAAAAGVAAPIAALLMARSTPHLAYDPALRDSWDERVADEGRILQPR